MKILSFSYEDLASGWTLTTATFDAMNLLVGASGVGKTQVVENLRAVVTVALLDNATLPRAKWVLRYEEGDRRWRWEAETALEEVEAGFPGLGAANTVFVSESLEDEQSGKIVFKRVGKRVELLGAEAPEVPAGRSMFGSFTADAVKEARDALRCLQFSIYSGRPSPVEMNSHPSETPRSSLLDELIQRSRADPTLVPGAFGRAIRSVASFRTAPAASLYIELLFVWYFGQENNSSEFDELRAKFCEIFPSVDDLRVRRSDEGDHALLHLEVRERGVPPGRRPQNCLKS